TTSSDVSITSSTRKPGKPNNASARPVPSLIAGVSSSLLPSTAVTMAGPLPHVVDPRLPATPYSNAKSRLAASVTQGFVLHASADLVDAAVREAHDVERVGDPAGVVQVWGEPGPVGLGEIGGDDSDPGEPVGVRLRGPAAQILGAVAFHHVDQHRSLQVDEA